MQALALTLKEVREELTSMSPVFRDDRLSVRSVMRQLHRDAVKGEIPFGFVNEIRREVKRLGFNA